LHFWIPGTLKEICNFFLLWKVHPLLGSRGDHRHSGVSG
jgi:hypothetical protein